MNSPSPEESLWKRVIRLTLWLWLAPPWGLWKLYHDTTLSASTRWRILAYAFVLPTLLYITVSVWMTNAALQKFLP